jgi:hypothetical protein
MYYLVSVDHNDMAVHLTWNVHEVLNIQCNGWDWWYLVELQWKRMGILGVSVRKGEGTLTVKMETVLLIGEGR